MKNTVISVAILAAIGVGGYIWYGARQQVDDATGVVMPEGAAVDAPAPLPDASSAAGGAADIAAPAADDTQATAPMGDITPETTVEAPADTATAPVESTTATGDTNDQAVSNDQAEGAAAPDETDMGTAAPDMSDGVVVPAPDMPATAGDVPPEDLLTAEGFDAEKIIALIDEADILPARKALLRTAVKRAAQNPQLMQSALKRVKLALGY